MANMVKIFDLWQRAHDEGGETVLGSADLHTHACYLIFGYLNPGQTGRLLNPGPGHEEIICLVSGRAVVSGPDGVQELQPGHAFYLKGDVTYTLSNPGSEPALYVAAGGHTPGAGHH